MTTLNERAREIYFDRDLEFAANTDRSFGYLFLFQWALSICLAVVASPQTWVGEVSETHIHVYAAVFLGGVIAGFPLFLIFRNPGTVLNRCVIAVSQILFSILLIHLTGGRIETHFHVFVSLAFLAFYRDWRPVVIATVITAADHLLRGAFWPQSVYGVLSATPWRAFEHAAWVLFEDIVLLYSMRLSTVGLLALAKTQANLEFNTRQLKRAHDELAEFNHRLEEKVLERTAQLQESQQKVLNQQQALILNSKMSALGEMAGGIAHEINTPLAIIAMRTEQLKDNLESGEIDRLDFLDGVDVIRRTSDRIAKIISGLRYFARDGSRDRMERVKAHSVIEKTMNFCEEKFTHHGIKLVVKGLDDCEDIDIECRSVEISQVLFNLLINSFDAVAQLPEKWIEIQIRDAKQDVELSVTDSGFGIPPQIREKIMQPFFTTKEIGRGTGLGLSIAKGIIEEHSGKLYVDGACANTRFVVVLPKRQAPSRLKRDSAA